MVRCTARGRAVYRQGYLQTAEYIALARHSVHAAARLPSVPPMAMRPHFMAVDSDHDAALRKCR
eukprot:1553967-Prymnesium_polylepis.1